MKIRIPNFVTTMALFTCVGCGGSAASVPLTGTITINKKAEANLLIQFSSLTATGGKTSTGSATSTEGGKFEILGSDGKPGLPPGDYVVTVVDRNLEMEDDELGKGKRIPPSRVNPKYLATDGKVNPLKVTVEAGKASYELVLD